MRPLPSEPLQATAPPFVVIGTPGDRRVDLFQAALHELRLPPAQIVPYTAIIEGRAALREHLAAGAIVRVESPGKDPTIQNQLIAVGAGIADVPGLNRIAAHDALRLPIERGRLHYVRQWYLGLRATLEEIDRQLAACPPHYRMNDLPAIALMFDKPACHARLNQCGIPVPRALGSPDNFETLREAMRQERCSRVFVKLAHGSSAAGVVAYQVSGDRQLALTTVEMVHERGELRLYNSRRLRAYRDPRDIQTLIDALCREHVHVEQWLPKAGIADRRFDLRVVVINGRARHVVVRLSRGPMTNLHLLNERGDVAAVRSRMGDAAWNAAMDTCTRTVAALGPNLYAGVDLLINTDYRQHAILEVNAFGDLLPGVLDEGQDTYTAEILAALERWHVTKAYDQRSSPGRHA
ncbi:MAG TPA: STM4014 family protein [Herpetosiphonaceae bacterium]